ncbi:LytR/AlgR family response regulator transcription factor [Chitinophaga vietnamensis]|uniref:LytR/AlgR family response regulator transcription factor n=1 Tax=Chitinophaga vietnamensis TaxID=2593957 RepID=UPI001178214F|nr:LytTR family DNA-binding domain-containing protein [Chitinophaga vietnamensis]
MKSLNCVVIEDSRIDRALLEEYLGNYDFIRIAGSFTNPLESLPLLKNTQVDLIITDVGMPLINGVDFIRSLQKAPDFIFVTIHPEYAIDAFELQAVDYLLKPVRPERLDRALKRLLELREIREKALQYDVQFEKDYMMIKEGNSINRVNLQDIVYLEALTNYTRIISTQKKYITLTNLKNFMDYLPGNKFLRIHRSYAVSLDKVKGLDGNEVLISEERLPLGKTYRQEVKKRIREIG